LYDLTTPCSTPDTADTAIALIATTAAIVASPQDHAVVANRCDTDVRVHSGPQESTTDPARTIVNGALPRYVIRQRDGWSILDPRPGLAHPTASNWVPGYK